MMHSIEYKVVTPDDIPGATTLSLPRDSRILNLSFISGEIRVYYLSSNQTDFEDVCVQFVCDGLKFSAENTKYVNSCMCRNLNVHLFIFINPSRMMVSDHDDDLVEVERITYEFD